MQREEAYTFAFSIHAPFRRLNSVSSRSPSFFHCVNSRNVRVASSSPADSVFPGVALGSLRVSLLLPSPRALFPVVSPLISVALTGIKTALRDIPSKSCVLLGGGGNSFSDKLCVLNMRIVPAGRKTFSCRMRMLLSHSVSSTFLPSPDVPGRS